MIVTESNRQAEGPRVARRASAAVLIGLLVGHGALAGQGSELKARLDRHVGAHQREIVNELVDLLSIPNVASDTEHIRQNVVALEALLVKRGLQTEVLETSGNPLVFGELKTPGATRTLLVYIHYDGQPVNPPEWKQAGPFTPVLRQGRMEDDAPEVPGFRTLDTFRPDWRLYARSASDDKGPIVAFLTAVDALKVLGVRPTSNIKLILDGEEEAGSPSLVPAIERHRHKLGADVMFILDGPEHPSGRPTLVFGARGSLGIELTVYGPKMPLHSGHYGNWVPNPAMRLAQLLATFKDDTGRVLVEGFYNGIEPVAGSERQMLDEVPDDPQALMALFGIAQPERPNLLLQDALQLPTFNVRGLSSAFVGGSARTIIPDRAVAAIDVRLVAETPAGEMLDKITRHIERQGYHIVTADPDDATRAAHSKIVKLSSRGDGTNAYRTSPGLPLSEEVSEALYRMHGVRPVGIRTSGGTVPIAPFIDALGFPAISVPTVNFDNNQHGENENVTLGQIFRAVTTIAALLTM